MQPGNPRILGVFTGQGAQWPCMGVEFLQSSPAARLSLHKLQCALDKLPEESRPQWSLLRELQEPPSSSRVMNAEFSQPLCTALKILQVDMLRAAGIELTAVVGHSSGEIAAAYAAGLLNAGDAICVAYHRGKCALPSGGKRRPGSMIAVGISQEDAQSILSFPEFHGRASIAAVNSPSSISISGDEDAIEELITIFKDEQKFVRKLRVDMAYHSQHMTIFSEPYIRALTKLEIRVGPGNKTSWFSSVTAESERVVGSMMHSLSNNYWVDNMVNPVKFMPALQNAIRDAGTPDLVIELGPHPALQGPALEVMQAELDLAVPYTGLFQRGKSSAMTFTDGLGYAWSHLERDALDLRRFDRFSSGISNMNLVKGLPSYAWDHQDTYWHESRKAQISRKRPTPAHMLLGNLTSDSTHVNMQWRNTLRTSNLPWLKDHCLQNIAVFPATGYIFCVLEAAMALSKDLTAAFGIILLRIMIRISIMILIPCPGVS